jgi:hypothetical protein
LNSYPADKNAGAAPRAGWRAIVALGIQKCSANSSAVFSFFVALARRVWLLGVDPSRLPHVLPRQTMLIFPNQAHAQIRTLRIACNAPNMASPPTAYALSLLQKEAELLGVTIFPQDGKGSAVQQSGDLMNSVNMGLDAIILEPNDEETLSETVNDVLASNMPIITISYHLKGVDKPLCQLSDEEHHLGMIEQARTALEALISNVAGSKTTDSN